MNLFWVIYLIGLCVALFYITEDFMKYCDNERLDYREELSDYRTLFKLSFASLGSWLTVIMIFLGKEED